MTRRKYGHRERIAAYHEAGHAVVVTIVGRGFIAVVLDEVGGAFRFARVDLAGSHTPQGARRELVVVQGGRAAETLRFARCHWASCASNEDHAIGLATLGDPTAPDALRDWAYQRAQDILTEHWPAVRQVAEELKQRRRVESCRVRDLVQGAPRCPIVYRVCTEYEPSQVLRSRPTVGRG
ncbi:MAG TPA: hypothetical protein VHL09_04905 [Dehalococcoidia bacterium]|nr:hypothetical protein [Dehalococcoidia bacterium]